MFNFSSFGLTDIAYMLMQVVCIVLSVMVHEIAHGYAAYRLGDPTAKRAGRLTLNPAKHLDPFGSIVLPLIMIAAHGPVFAYAKPVPYNPAYFKNRKEGELIVAFAGPLSNLAQALIGALIHEPKLLLMDEPFVGLDPKAAHDLKMIMADICQKGGAIFFSTHVLEVAEKLCHKVAIIKEGKLAACGTMEEVKGDESLEQVFLELVDDEKS